MPWRPATVQVDFTFGGGAVGRAWRAVIVTARRPRRSRWSPTRPRPGAGATPLIAATSAASRPDLIITITGNDDDTVLEWQFTTRYAGVSLPDDPVRKKFVKHNAKSFAMHEIRLIDQAIGPAALGNRILGASRAIADQIPSQAWRVLSDVWAETKKESRYPSVLLISTEAFVPWELASTEPRVSGPDPGRFDDPVLLGGPDLHQPMERTPASRCQRGAQPADAAARFARDRQDRAGHR